MWQELDDAAGLVRGQSREHVLEVGIRVVPVHTGRLDQAHDGGRSLARTQAAGKQPVVTTDGNGPDLVLDPVVVDRQLSVIHESGQRSPAPLAVVQRLGGC